jgi:ceramide glucosyltransferase
MPLDWMILIAASIALAYQAASLLASILFAEKRRVRYGRTPLSSLPPVSVLKPVRGLDDNLLEALRSHLKQDYPEYEVLIGIHSREDPAWPVLEQLQREFPDRPLRIVLSTTQAENAKVGVLIDLARLARHPVWLMSDADIQAEPDYLRRVTAPLDDERTGLVTCLYRPSASSLAGRFEALVIATDFIPSTLVAPIVGVREFGLGSTICFRAKDLQAAGGFERLAAYIADDYQLAKAITSSGKRATFSEVVVDTTLSDPGWRDVWRHQMRWARTIRVSRLDGFAGLPVTHAGLWALLCAATGQWPMALTLWLARCAAGAFAGFVILRHWPALLLAPLLPLCDLWGFALWCGAWLGRTAWWRGRLYRLEADGRIRLIGEQSLAAKTRNGVGMPEKVEEHAHGRQR